MKVKVQKVYGSAKLELEIDAADLKEALFKGSIFTQKDRCVLCKQEEIGLEGNRDKEGNIYVKRRCRACTAASSLGSYKTGGYFWHNWEKYDPNKPKNPNGTYAPVKEEFQVDDNNY